MPPQLLPAGTTQPTAESNRQTTQSRPRRLLVVALLDRPAVVGEHRAVPDRVGWRVGAIGDVDEPADVIGKAKSLVKNGKIGKLGAKAREFVQKYSWNSITDKFEKILEGVIEEKGK